MAGVVTPLTVTRLYGRPLRRQTDSAFPLLFGDTCGDLQGCLDRIAFYGLQDLGCDFSVRLQATERDTPSFTMVDVRPAAMIPGHLAVATTIGDVHHPTTSAAAQ